MIKQYERNTVLRLIALLVVTQSGLKQQDFDFLRRTYIHCYGYQELITLMNMQDSMLLRAKDKRFDWPKMKKVFGLINEEVKIDRP